MARKQSPLTGRSLEQDPAYMDSPADGWPGKGGEGEQWKKRDLKPENFPFSPYLLKKDIFLTSDPIFVYLHSQAIKCILLQLSRGTPQANRTDGPWPVIMCFVNVTPYKQMYSYILVHMGLFLWADVLFSMKCGLQLLLQAVESCQCVGSAHV